MSDEDVPGVVKALLTAVLGSTDNGKFYATESASSLPALRNDSGEAVWRLTEKAMEYLRGLRGLPFRTVDEVLMGPGQCSELCDTADTSKASEP